MIFEKSHHSTLQTPGQNQSILHQFRGKYIFAFYTEIQDGCQKWWENKLLEKSPGDSTVTLGVKNSAKISHRFRDKYVFVFCTEIQKKWKTNLGKIHQLTLHACLSQKIH